MITDVMAHASHTEPVRLVDIPLVELGELRAALVDGVAGGGRVVALFGQPTHDDDLRLYAVLAFAESATLAVLSTDVGDQYPSLTDDCPQVHAFEREIAEQWAVVPYGHPSLKPLRFHRSYRAGRDAWSRDTADAVPPGVTDFDRVRGPEVHEVAVGPIHARAAESGHFRFQCHGDEVLHLELALGFQHRGIERALVGGPDKRTVHLMECIAGDASIGHATAYCQAFEALAGARTPLRAQALRGIGLELERLANHTGDLGALAAEVGFQPTMTHCGRIRGDLLNAMAHVCGNRFGRGLVRPGGAGCDLTPDRVRQLVAQLQTALGELETATCLLWDSSSARARLDDIGRVSRADAEALGLVGPAARACGLERDARYDFPSGIYRFAAVPVSSWPSGDVFARAYVRWLEIERSTQFLLEQLRSLAEGPVRSECEGLAADSLVVSLVEGARGEICHVALTDADGRFARYKIVDPSFHNWAALPIAARGLQISDFPLCHKSFSLSFCGHDL